MNPASEVQTPSWKLFWGERKPIALGLTCGSVFSALFPLVKSAFHIGRIWLKNPSNADGNALPAVVGVIVVVVLLIWPGPLFLRWCRSLRGGLCRGSFAVPFVAMFLTLGLRYRIPALWWHLTIPVVFALTTGCLYAAFARSRRVHIITDDSDEAKVSIEDAWPQRKSLAEHIASSILADGKATYAIYGGFGSGKSSMLNFVAAALNMGRDQSPIIVRFSGWLPGSQDNLADQLLHDIAAECSKRFYLPGLRRSALRLARALTTSIPHASGFAELIPQSTQNDAVNEFKSVLDNLPLRVVVLVDEIDRMRKEELFTLLKLIRGFYAHPRISFVCALERDHVEKLIREEFGSVDSTFYHKFFAESFTIPKLLGEFLESETHAALMSVFDRLDWFKGNEKARDAYSNQLRDHWRDIFVPLCTNAREINRLATSLRTQAWRLIDEVDPLDLTLVAALRHFAPDALDLIWSCGDVLCAHDLNGSINAPDRAYEAAVSSYLEREGKLFSGLGLREQVRRVRDLLFDGLEGVLDSRDADTNKRVSAKLRYFELNQAAARTRRLRSRSYFPAYFQDVLPGAIFPEKELSRVLEELRVSDEFKGTHLLLNELGKFAENGAKKLNFLDKLKDNATRVLDLDKCMWVANVLVSRSAGLDDPNQELEHRQITQFVANVSDELFLAGKLDLRLQFAQKCILAARSDGVAVRIFQWTAVGRTIVENITSAQRGVQPIARENLEAAYLSRMEDRYGPAIGLDRVDLNLSYWQAFGEWGRMLKKSPWARDEEMQWNFWKRYISSPENMSTFVHFALEPLLVYGQNLPQTPYAIDDFLPKEMIRDMARHNPPYDDPMALSCLREILGKDALPEPLNRKPAP